jgi:hypothetical protein
MFSMFPNSAYGTEEGGKSNIKPGPKRRQVARACTWCRTYRIKCDTKVPCYNCNQKRRKCTIDEGKDAIRTFPSAIKSVVYTPSDHFTKLSQGN